MKKFIQSGTRERLKKLKTELRRAAHTPDDQDAIHDLRVAIRRFTQCTRTFEQFFDKARIKHLRRRLRKVMDHCAAVRNCDIALEVLRGTGFKNKKLSADLTDQRRHAQKDLAHSLRSLHSPKRSHFRVSHKRAGAWNLKETPTENARRVLPRLARELFRSGDLSVGLGHQKVHQFRLQVKQFRYTLELFQHLYSPEVERAMDMLRELQDKIGAISDCGATLDLVKKDRRATAAVQKLLHQREEKFRAYWANECGPRVREWWKSILSGAGDLVAGDVASKETAPKEKQADKIAALGRQSGTVHLKTRGSGTAGKRNSGRRKEARLEGKA